MRWSLVQASVLLVVAGCRELGEVVGEGARLWTTTANITLDGKKQVSLPVRGDEDSLLVTLEVPPPNLVHVRSLSDADGEVVFDYRRWSRAQLNLTNAGFPARVVSLGWPIVADDPGLHWGDWTLEIGLVDADLRFTDGDVQVSALLTDDDDRESGTLSVAFVYTDGLELDDDFVQGVQAAVRVFREVYQAQGIEVRTTVLSHTGQQLAPPVREVEPAYVGIAANTPFDTVHVVFSEIVQGGFAGIAGDSPGPLIPTTRSAVQIGAWLAMGVDGVFSDREVAVLGETIAHEVSHYLGLFHPVELDWVTFDALPDTPACDDAASCLAQVGSNLMYPLITCVDDGCPPQNELTPDQRAVLQRYAGVRETK
ncbi:MAG: hypothetical protein KTR31_22075 [Myxococcales bacterium]|nr:hypothetical protein [Myxococcales bacterium]